MYKDEKEAFGLTFYAFIPHFQGFRMQKCLIISGLKYEIPAIVLPDGHMNDLLQFVENLYKFPRLGHLYRVNSALWPFF